MPCPYENATSKRMSMKIPRRQYADLYGPTTGDRVRLADTELFIEIRKGPHDSRRRSAKFGGGKVIATAWGNPRRRLPRTLAFSIWLSPMR